MDEFWKSCAEAIKRRASTALLGTYTFFWLAYHWQGVYTTLFVSPDLIYKKYGLLKNEYVVRFFPGYHGIKDWHFYLELLVPALLTYCFIWVLPDLLFIRAFRKERAYKFKKRKLILEDETRVEEFKATLAQKSAKTLIAEKELVKQEQEIMELDPKKVWEADFEKFKKDPAFLGFDTIIESIYSHNGKMRTTSSYDGHVTFEVPSGGLATAHSNDLINIDNKAGTIELTEKGKFFVSRFPLGK